MLIERSLFSCPQQSEEEATNRLFQNYPYRILNETYPPMETYPQGTLSFFSFNR